MNELKNSVQSTETGKAAYVKPTMQVYEMEVESAVLQSSGDNGIGGGGGGRGYRSSAPGARSTTWGNIWDDEETM